MSLSSVDQETESVFWLDMIEAECWMPDPIALKNGDSPVSAGHYKIAHPEELFLIFRRGAILFAQDDDDEVFLFLFNEEFLGILQWNFLAPAEHAIADGLDSEDSAFTIFLIVYDEIRFFLKFFYERNLVAERHLVRSQGSGDEQKDEEDSGDHGSGIGKQKTAYLEGLRSFLLRLDRPYPKCRN